MTVDNLGLRLRLAVRAPVIRRGEDLQVEAVLTNTTDQPLVVNTWILDYASLVLDLERIQERDKTTPVRLGPPPTPPAPDDTSGQMPLAPKESVRFVYDGQKFLVGQVLTDGNYRVRLAYDNRDGLPREWHGVLETDWLRFRIDASLRP
jgi:hypothetical protein